MLKAGQYIGMGNGRVGLLVEVRAIHGDKMDGRVVNGGWNFIYSLSLGKMEYHSPSGYHTQRADVLFSSPYPKGLGDYNGIIEYMNDHLASSRYTRIMFKATAFFTAVGCSIREAPTRFMNALRGLRSGWNASLDTKKTASFHDDDYFDDDIPF